MTPIRTTDKQGIDGIILTGRPAGYWMAQSEAFPRIYTGVAADGERRTGSTEPSARCWSGCSSSPACSAMSGGA